MEGATARVSDIPVLVRESWNPETCPAALLPWLAFAFSVDAWDSSWTEAQKRQVILDAVFVHRHKGTLGAVKRALSSLGLEAEVTEWFQETPQGDPYTFKIGVDVSDTGVSDDLYNQALDVVMRTKNLRSHLAAMTLRGTVKGPVYIGAAVMSGMETTIYPFIQEDVEIASPLYAAAAERSVDTVQIYPAS